MQIRNLRSFAVEIPEVGIVDAGDVIEVPEDLGVSLVEQADVWESVKPKAAKAQPSEDV